MISPFQRAHPRPYGLAALWLALVLIVCVPRATAAQAVKAVELSAGYSFVRDEVGAINFPVGWTVGAGATFNDVFAVVGEFGASHKTIRTIVGDVDLGIRTLMVGGKVSARIGPFVEFAQVLGGVVYARSSVLGVSDSETHGGVQGGGGLEYRIARKLVARGEVDVRVIGSRPGTDVGREVRFLTGIAYTLF